LVFIFLYKKLMGRPRCGKIQFFTLWGWNIRTDCPERQWRPRPWKYSRPAWTGFWATWSSWRCPCSLRGGVVLN